LLKGNSCMFGRGCNGVVFLAVITLTCAPLLSDRDRPADYSGVGMKKISASGKSFLQGWNGVQSSYDERPGMESGFSYDYWLDSTEVTQGQYYAVTGKRPVSGSSQYGFGDDYPVYRVSWFDAVLYCNGRSKQEQLDTVYTYSGKKLLSNGTVYELTGLGYDVGRNGYRLPTESEWEYAARDGSSALPYSTVADSVYASYYAWYGKNSLNRTHPVAARLPNSLGLYDMAGNVFEWTNDWKCVYTGQRITNSLGALHPGNEYEKVIKGGSYNYSLMNLRPSSRSATYATMLASANEYVGFRCARGVITNGQYIGRETTFRPNPVTIMTGGSDLRSFIGTSEAKLVFVNVTGNYRTLCYVDFSRTFPDVVQYTDDRNVYHPTISSDGRYVAYCSRNEGQSGPSKISIRSLDSLNTTIVQLSTDTAYIPRWWINPGTGDTCIVYTNSGIENGNPLWSQTKTYIQKMSGGNPAAGIPLQELIGSGSYHDGISSDGQYAVTGYKRLMRRDIVAGTDSQLFVYPENGKGAGGSNQVCNVSMSPGIGDSVRSMFLDFGCYPEASTVIGSSYGVHEYLFVGDMDGRVTNYMRCPVGEQSWDGVEWTNQSRFGVGCGRNGANQSHAVYAIDLEEKISKQLVTGTELQHPYMLTGNPLFLVSDSLGRYNEPPTDANQACLATKLLMFWRFYDSLDVAIVGSSQANWGINPQMIMGLKTYNLASPWGDGLAQKNIILNYVVKHCQNIKIICSSFDVHCIDNQDMNSLWKNGVGISKGFLYDSCHSFWTGGMTSDFKQIICQVPLPSPHDTANMGFKSLPPTGWGNEFPPIGGSLSWDITDPTYQRNLATITMMAGALRNRMVHWIIIIFPVSPNYKETNSFCYWGPSWQTAHEIIQNLKQLESSNNFFHLYDAYLYGVNDYDSLDFFDYHHLSEKGAAKLSVRVDSIIHTILP
jgi:uncharacterized protein (TIGR02171 family)